MQFLSSSEPIDRTLRKGILAGIGLCAVTIALSIYLYPGLAGFPSTSKFLPLFLAGVVWYGLAAWRLMPATTRDEFVVLQYGARWGMVIGLAWIVEVVVGNLILPNSPIGLLATLTAVILPVVAGATGTAVTGRVSTGARIGFWSGVVSGLIAFLVIASAGFLAANFPEFLGDQEIQPATYNFADYLGSAVSHLVLVGAVFCSAAGALGGLVGRVVARSSQPQWLSH